MFESLTKMDDIIENSLVGGKWLIVVATFIAIFASVLKFAIQRWRFIALAERIPGPSAPFPIIGNALQFVHSRTETSKIYSNNFKKYGPIFRLWLGPIPFVFLKRAEETEVLLGSAKHLKKSIFYDILRPFMGDGLFVSNGTKWHARRKLMTPTFHFKILEVFAEVFRSNADILAQRLDKHADGQPFDVNSYIAHTMLEGICETAMGTNINQDNEGKSEYATMIYEIEEIMMLRSRHLWLFFDPIFNFTKEAKRFRVCIKSLHNFTDNIISKRRQYRAKNKAIEKHESTKEIYGMKKRYAFIDLLLEAVENGDDIDDESIRDEVNAFTSAGYDTLTATLSWCLIMLGNHQDYQELAYREVVDIFQDSDRPITMDDIAKMKYIERFMKETLRMYPSAPMFGRTLEEDTKIGEYLVPAGTNVTVCLYDLHRDPKYFPDPEKFDPDRFLPEVSKNRHPFAYIPFSAGLRNCIGQKYAVMQVKIVLATILRKFKVFPVDKLEDMSLILEFVIKSNIGYKIRLERRK